MLAWRWVVQTGFENQQNWVSAVTAGKRTGWLCSAGDPRELHPPRDSQDSMGPSQPLGTGAGDINRAPRIRAHKDKQQRGSELRLGSRAFHSQANGRQPSHRPSTGVWNQENSDQDTATEGLGVLVASNVGSGGGSRGQGRLPGTLPRGWGLSGPHGGGVAGESTGCTCLSGVQPCLRRGCVCVCVSAVCKPISRCGCGCVCWVCVCVSDVLCVCLGCVCAVMSLGVSIRHHLTPRC